LSDVVRAFSQRRKARGAGREALLFTCRRQRSTSCEKPSQQRGATPRRSGYRKIAKANLSKTVAAVMRYCSRGPLGRLLGVKTERRDGPALLAPKARHSRRSLGQRPRVMKIKKKLALKARFTSGTPVGSAPIESRFQRLFTWRFEFLGRCPRFATANPSCGGLV
jgi:hypothetical protein